MACLNLPRLTTAILLIKALLSLTIDDLQSARVVLADGTLVTACATELKGTFPQYINNAECKPSLLPCLILVSLDTNCSNQPGTRWLRTSPAAARRESQV